MSLPKYELIDLTDDQKAIVMANYDKMKIGPLTALVFPGCNPDGRTTEGKSIQAFLAGINQKAETNKHKTSMGPVELTDQQKTLIDELAGSGRVKNSLELARLVFPSSTNKEPVKGLSREWRAVWAYAKDLYPDTFSVTEEPVDELMYQPPDRLSSLIGVVNEYVTTGDNSRKTYNQNTLKISDTRNLNALMSYLRVYRFKYVASTYDKRVDRDLFISTFIRWTHNKPDLTEIEVDQMISAASETVNIAQMEREVQEIRQYHRSVMSGDEVDAQGKQKRFGMTEVEQITQTRTKWDAAKARVERLMSGLEEARSKRIDANKGRSGTIWNLFEAWENDPTWRAAIIGVGQREKQEDAEEVKRLSNMPDVIALISGQTEEEGGA